LGEDEDETVNIIIKNGYLDLVTKDGMPDEPGVPIYDAKGAVLLGILDVGKPAAFLLLDESPRRSSGHPGSQQECRLWPSYFVSDNDLLDVLDFFWIFW